MAIEPDEHRRLREAKILDQIQESVITTDLDGYITSWNKGAERMYSYTSGEALGRHISFIYPEDEREFLQREVIAPLKEKGEHRSEVRLIRKSGEKFYALLLLALLRDEKGNVTGMLGSSVDITQRKRTEEQLIESEERFRSSFEHAAIGMALVGMDGRFLKVNQSLCRIVGYSEEEFLDLTFQEITYPDDLDADLALSRKLFEGEIPSYKMEKRYIHKNGQIIWILLSGSVVRDGDGKIICAIAQIQDISDRKAAEEKLRMQIERYDLVAAGVRDGIWDWDVSNKRVFFSSRWKAMRGLAEEEVGNSEDEWSSRIHPEDAPRVFANVQAHFEGKTPWFSEEYRVRCKDGSWMWVHDRGLALRDASGRVIRMAGSESDITVRKHLEEEREKLIAELKEALAKVKTLSGLLPICSHCKKIRDDKGYWKQIEIYIRDRSEAEFSHGICPDCVKEFYPEQYEKIIGMDIEE